MSVNYYKSQKYTVIFRATLQKLFKEFTLKSTISKSKWIPKTIFRYPTGRQGRRHRRISTRGKKQGEKKRKTLNSKDSIMVSTIQ